MYKVSKNVAFKKKFNDNFYLEIWNKIWETHRKGEDL